MFTEVPYSPVVKKVRNAQSGCEVLYSSEVTEEQIRENLIRIASG